MIRLNDPISESLKVLVEYFNSRNVPYVIVGGVSVLILGRSRLTMDIDIIVDHTKLDREDFVNFLKSNNFDATLKDFEGFDEQTHCSIFYKDGMFRIDIKGVYTALERESIDKSIVGLYDGISIKIDNPQNIVLFKLKYGSEQDYEDALAVYIRNMEIINKEELKEKAKEMSVSDKLESFLNEVESFLKEKGEIF